VVERHVYQRSGLSVKLIVPWSEKPELLSPIAPLLAKQVSSKLAYGSARDAQRDLGENHSRKVAVSYIQRLCEAVASIIEAKEESCNYVPPKMDALINSVAIGLDGTCMLLQSGVVF
jgi:hypothetical protein